MNEHNLTSGLSRLRAPPQTVWNGPNGVVLDCCFDEDRSGGNLAVKDQRERDSMSGISLFPVLSG